MSTITPTHPTSPDPAVPAPQPSLGRLLASCLLGGSAGWGMTAAGAGTAGLTAAYDVGLVMVGLFTTALAIPYAVLQLPAGSLVDRIGIRRAALLGLGLVVAAYVVASTVSVPALALAARAVAGAGTAVCFVAGAELARQSGWGPSGLGVFGGLTIGAGGIAVVVVPAAEPLLAWRSAWLTSAAAAAVAMIAVAWAARDMAVRRVRNPSREGRAASLWRDGELHRLGAIHAVTLGLSVVLSNFATVILHDRWGLPMAVAAATGSLILLSAIVSRPLGGWLTGRAPDRTRAMTAGALIASAVGTALLARPTHLAVAVVAVLALGVGSGLPFATVIGAAQDRRPDRPAAAIGLMNGHANGLLVLGTPLLGAVIERDVIGPGLVTIGALFLLPLLGLPRSIPGRRPHERAAR